MAQWAATRVEWGATWGAQEATAAMRVAQEARAATAAEHVGTTLLSSHMPLGKNSNTTIPILNIPALHNNTTMYSLYIQ